ncbi:AAA family ATPase [Clostridium ljungdahlii]|uniref:Shikimate kinase n=1 Tax=Clostridium ljungdahlii (strain ATCC 55383 / DSM 13528 / PETC) TaxID=748727 RepID=D8GS78_CLOLD|nr:AAA family ATPase [Clostridium ljungdahlii]ADK14431.1 shikimate kinase-like protein [Clostridium ljungdahlii DSM 13528]OAA88149.1 Shikimate kinase [Clostridium ljungdahlii DSM 13528]
MTPRAVFLVGPAGSGKSTVGKLIASHFQFAYLDKDVVCNKFTGKLLETQGISPDARDGCEFYQKRIMPMEYETLLQIAADNIKSGISVVLDAPFVGYFTDENYINKLKEKYSLENYVPLVLRVSVSAKVLLKRIRERNFKRDEWKLKNWDIFIDSLKSKQCLWKNVKIKEFDNSNEEIDTNNLFKIIEENC